MQRWRCAGERGGSRGSILVKDDQCGDGAGHPSGAGEEENDEHRTAPTVKHRQRREENGEKDAEEGHGGGI